MNEPPASPSDAATCSTEAATTTRFDDADRAALMPCGVGALGSSASGGTADDDTVPLGPRSMTDPVPLAVPAAVGAMDVSNDTEAYDGTSETMLPVDGMVRAATEGINVNAVLPPTHNGDINYDLDLPLGGDAPMLSPTKVPPLDRHRARTLRQPFDSAEERRIFRMSFTEWKAVDRSVALPGWSRSVPSPIPIDRIEPIAATDVHILDKVALVRCGVTELALDAIVNAANEACLGGGGVDGAVHRAAGPLLLRECSTFMGCRTGHTRITKGYHLPSRFVLHTVGPMGRQPKHLRSCYRSCMQLAMHHNLRSIGFCCVSTGIFGYPLVEATTIALTETFSFLKQHRDRFDMLCFACYTDKEYEVYRQAVDNVYREVMTRE